MMKQNSRWEAESVQNQKICAWGYPKMATRSEDDKKRGSLALLEAIFKENGLQDGGQNR